MSSEAQVYSVGCFYQYLSLHEPSRSSTGMHKLLRSHRCVPSLSDPKDIDRTNFIHIIGSFGVHPNNGRRWRQFHRSKVSEVSNKARHGIPVCLSYEPHSMCCVLSYFQDLYLTHTVHPVLFPAAVAGGRGGVQASTWSPSWGGDQAARAHLQW
jgi:hypothetical protein